MTVHSVKQGADPDVLNVGLSDGSFFLFRTDYLASGAPLPVPGLALSEDSESAYRIAGETYSAELSALRLISIREHSRFLLAAKLKKREFAADTVRTVLDRLERIGLLDDERFSELWLAHRAASKNEGRAKLLAGLLGRGVPKSIAECAVKKAVTEEDEIKAVRRLAEKAKLDTRHIDSKARSRLLAAGFSGKIVKAAFSGEEL